MRPVKHHPWSEEDYTSRSWVMGIIQVLEASYFYRRDSWYQVWTTLPSNCKTIPMRDSWHFELFVKPSHESTAYETGKSKFCITLKSPSVRIERGIITTLKLLRVLLLLDDDLSRPWHGFRLLFKVQLSRSTSTSLLLSWLSSQRI